MYSKDVLWNFNKETEAQSVLYFYLSVLVWSFSMSMLRNHKHEISVSKGNKLWKVWKKHRKYPREKQREYGDGVSGSLRSWRWTWQAFILVGYKFVTGLLVQFSENEIAKK